MKLLNYTSSYFSVVLMIIIPVWAGLFYIAMLDEVYDSMDDGLDNQRLLIIAEAKKDPHVLTKTDFGEANYAIAPLPPSRLKTPKDSYIDTLMYMQNEQDYEPVRMLKTVFKNGDRFYQMRVITSMVEEDDLIKELTQALILLYLGLILTIVVLNNFLLKNIWRPFYMLMKQLRNFKLADGGPLQLSKTRIDEFNILQNTVQRFLSKSVESYTKQKQFIENAAHELQTPVAIAVNKLELLAGSAELTDRQAELLGSAMDNLERLKRLNKSLLLLSKIENDQFDGRTEVSVNRLTRKLTDDFREQLDFYGLSLVLDEPANCTWFINPDLAEILLSNLIKNTIKHGIRGTTVRVSLTRDRFEISNEGNEPLDETLIFNRFYKGGESGESTGLGLAISKAIADINNLEVNYRYAGKHIFSVVVKN